MKISTVIHLLKFYLLPTIATTAFALLSYPELVTLLLKAIVSDIKQDTTVLGDVKTYLIAIGFLFTIFSIYYARREIGSLSNMNKALLQQEDQLKMTEKNLLKRENEWEQFKEKAFDGLKNVLDAYLRNYTIQYYRKNNGGAHPPSTLRISIYTHDKMANVCYLVGRYSFNNFYCKAGRGVYPIDSGAIGRAWISGEIRIKLQHNSEHDPKGWQSELITEYKMEKKVVENLTMKSQVFYAKRIAGGADGSTPIGVALIETTDSSLSVLEEGLLNELLEDNLVIIRNFMLHDYELQKQYPRGNVGA